MKNWIITGASSGIGEAIAKTALKNGDRVLVTSRKTEKLQPLTQQFPESCIPAELDLTSEKSIKNFVELAKEKFSQVDVLVNNAGYGYLATVEEGKREEIKELFDTNLFGPITLMQAFLPQMRESKSGTIVNISSINAVQADAGSAFYAATKAALTRLSEGMQEELAPFDIKVITIEPGGFDTNFYHQNLQETKEKIADYSAVPDLDRKDNIPADFKDPGNPAKAGKIIYQAINDPDSPSVLLLGSDAVEIAEEKLHQQLAEIKKWKKVSQKTDY